MPVKDYRSARRARAVTKSVHMTDIFGKTEIRKTLLQTCSSEREGPSGLQRRRHNLTRLGKVSKTSSYPPQPFCLDCSSSSSRVE